VKRFIVAHCTTTYDDVRRHEAPVADREPDHIARQAVGRTRKNRRSLAGAGKVLELGIGTGRVAIPLAARGVAVHGIEAS
jgi:2-polyprenyl-3-methyl-5-hydroxy-6-metoxy-1,4-benzoquinol methylase